MNTVLSFIDWYLPGSKAGGALKAFANQVSHFHEDYKFKIITRDTDYTETAPYENVTIDAWNLVEKNVDVFYTSKKNINHGFMKNLVQNTKFDSVYIHGIYSYWFSILPIFLVKRMQADKIVVAAHGMFGDHAKAVKSTKKKLFITAARATGLYKNVYFHAANQAEAEDIQKTLGVKTKVIIAEEMPMKVSLADWQSRAKTAGEVKLVSIARISPEKNTLYALERLEYPSNCKITYDIYGPIYSEQYWEKCQQVIATLPPNVSVHYHGSLPGEQVLETLKKYHFLFLPSTGENFGHIILESFMAATPVIISNKTPWQSLEERGVGWELDLQEKAAFSAKITHAAKIGQQEYDELSRNSHNYALEFMNDESVMQQNERLFSDDLSSL